MPEKVQKGARVPLDLAEQIERYATEREISESEAIRRLLRDGLRYQERDEVLERLERIEADLNRSWFRRLLG